MSDERYDDSAAVENRELHQAAVDNDEELGDAIGAAVARQAESPVEFPSVVDITKRAAARARARRVRHGVGGVAAAAALVAGGLVAWSTLNGDGGSGNVGVATGDTAQEEATPPLGEPNPAQQGGDGSPAPSTESGAPTPDATGGGAAAEPAGPNEPTAAVDPQASNPAGAQALLAPAEFSTGPTLSWVEVPVDLDEGPTGSVRLESLGDGRVVAMIRGESSDRVAVTDNGTDWTVIAVPDEVFPHSIAVSGERWLMAAPGSAESGDIGRVLVSVDNGETWSDLAVGAGSQTGLPQHCVERSAITDVLISGDHVVVLSSLHRFLDIEALLVERGLIPAGTLAHEWRRSENVLTIRLGNPGSWSDSGPEEFLEVTLEELALTPEQLDGCDDYASGRVRVHAGDTSVVEYVAEHEGWAASAVATRDGFAMVVADEATVQWLTSSDGHTWTGAPATELGHGTVAGVSNGTIWLSENRGGLRISRGDVGSVPQVVAGFDGLEPVGVLSAGPAGVATTVWALPDALTQFLGTTSFAKDGYELRLENRAGATSLWDLGEDVAVYEFSAEQMRSEQPPEGIQQVTGDDGSLTLVFSDPSTGEELVRFSESDLVPDTDALIATRQELFGPLGIPPIWLGWSANGELWGWQDAAEAFGLADGEGLTAVDLAVGGDFVLARVATFEQAEVLAMAQATEFDADPPSGPPSSWQTRWFIAQVR